MVFTVIIFVFLLCYAALIFFYYLQWKKLKEYHPSSSPTIFVSVLIAARNEEKNLPLLIKDLHQQDYPSQLFEVIIVNDFSTDNTAPLAATLPVNFKMITPDCLPEQSSKKKAVATGVQQAKGELMVITDADCRVQKKWLSTIASFYQQTNASFIAAPVKFTHDNSLLQIFQSLDFITLQGITAASVAGNFHNMCNGANLAYTKKAFESVNGFAGIDKVPTGDDMLLMHKIWKQDPSKVYYLKSKEVIVSTEPMLTWKDFFMQRRRWASKTMLYDDYRIITVLGFVLLLNLLPFVLLVAAIVNANYWLHFVVLLLGKTIIEAPFVFTVAKFYEEQKLMRYFFFLQPLHVFYTVFIGIWSQFKNYEWKGRKARPPYPPKGGVAGAQGQLMQEAGNNSKDSQLSGISVLDTPPLGGRGAG